MKGTSTVKSEQCEIKYCRYNQVLHKYGDDQLFKLMLFTKIYQTCFIALPYDIILVTYYANIYVYATGKMGKNLNRQQKILEMTFSA